MRKDDEYISSSTFKFAWNSNLNFELTSILIEFVCIQVFLPKKKKRKKKKRGERKKEKQCNLQNIDFCRNYTDDNTEENGVTRASHGN